MRRRSIAAARCSLFSAEARLSWIAYAENGVDSRARFAEVTGLRVSMDAREPVLFKNVGIIGIQYELSRPDIRFHETNQRPR